MNTGAGHKVYVNPTHMAQHRDVLPYLEEALLQVFPPEGQIFYKVDVDMGRIIGHQACVRVTEDDTFIHAQRKNRAGLTRFVLNRLSEPTSYVTIVLARDRKKENIYRVLTAYIGRVSEREPTDPSIKTDVEMAVSVAFWKDRALVWGSQIVVPGTEEPPLQEVELEFDFEGLTETGHKQMYTQSPQGIFAICCSCKAMMMPNRGGGMACDKCQHEWEIEMSHDYDNGEL